MLVAVDLGKGEPVAVGYVDEYNPQAVRRWLEPLVKQLGVSVIVTDDLVHYKTVLEKLDVEHQICQFHVRRWVGRVLKELHETVPEPYRKVVDEVKQIISELPRKAVNACLNFGSKSPSAEWDETSLCPPWINYAICWSA